MFGKTTKINIAYTAERVDYLPRSINISFSTSMQVSYILAHYLLT